MRTRRLLQLACLAVATAARADEEVPARTRALVLLRVLAYDRKLSARVGTAEVTVVVVFRAGDTRSESDSRALASAIDEAARDFRVGGRRPRAVLAPWRDEVDLAARLAAEHAAALWVADDLDDQVGPISRVTRARSVLSFSPRRKHVRDGLAVAITGGGARAGIVVNLQATRAEGADLEAPLLGIAEVIGP